MAIDSAVKIACGTQNTYKLPLTALCLGKVIKIEKVTTFKNQKINNLNRDLPLYLEEIKRADYYQNRLNYYANLVNTTPKNLYRPVPPQIYQRFEPVIDKKSYKINRERWLGPKVYL